MAKDTKLFDELFAPQQQETTLEDLLFKPSPSRARPDIPLLEDRLEVNPRDTYLPPELRRERGTTFGNSFEAGVKNLLANKDLFDSLFYDAVGQTRKADKQIQEARRLQGQAAEAMATVPDFTEFLNEPTVGGFLTQAVSAIGQFTPSAIASIASAFAGGGAFALARAGIGATATRQAMSQAAKQVSKKKMQGAKLNPDEETFLKAWFEILKGRTPTGSYNPGFIAGAASQELIQGSGISYGEFEDLGQRDRYARTYALGTGLGYAAIGVAGESAVVTAFTRMVNRSKGQFKKTLARDTMFGLGIMGAISEGAAETAQEGLNIKQKLRTDPDYSVNQAKLDAVQAAFAGVVGGFGLGAAGGSLGNINRMARKQFVDAAQNTDLFKGIVGEDEENISLKERIGINEPYVMAVADKEGKIVTGIPHNENNIKEAETQLKNQVPGVGTPESEFRFLQDTAEGRNADGTLKPMTTEEYLEIFKKQEGITDEQIIEAYEVTNFNEDAKEETQTTKANVPVDEYGQPLGYQFLPDDVNMTTTVVRTFEKRGNDKWFKDYALTFKPTANPNIQRNRSEFDRNLSERGPIFTREDLIQWQFMLADRQTEVARLQTELKNIDTLGEYLQEFNKLNAKNKNIENIINESHIGQPKNKVFASVLGRYTGERVPTTQTDRNRPITEEDLVAVNSVLPEGAKPYGAKDPIQTFAQDVYAGTTTTGPRETFGNELIGQPLYTLFSDALMNKIDELVQERPGSLFEVHLETNPDNDGYGQFKIFETAALGEINFVTTTQKINAGISEAIATEKRKLNANPNYKNKGGSGWYLVARRNAAGEVSDGVLPAVAKEKRVPISMSRLTLRGAQINKLRGQASMYESTYDNEKERFKVHMADGFMTAMVELDRLGYDIEAAVHQYKWKDGRIDRIAAEKYTKITDDSFLGPLNKMIEEDAVAGKKRLKEEQQGVFTEKGASLVPETEKETKEQKTKRNRIDNLVIYESALKGTNQYELEQAEKNYLDIKDPEQRTARAAYDVEDTPVTTIKLKNIVSAYVPDFLLIKERSNIKKRQDQLANFFKFKAFQPGASVYPTVFFSNSEIDQIKQEDLQLAEEFSLGKNQTLYTEPLIERDLERLSTIEYQLSVYEDMWTKPDQRRDKQFLQEEIDERLAESRDYLFGLDADPERADYGDISLDDYAIQEAMDQRRDNIYEVEQGSYADAELNRNRLIRDYGGMGISSAERIENIIRDYKSIKNYEQRPPKKPTRREEEEKLSIDVIRRRNEELKRKLAAEAKEKETAKPKSLKELQQQQRETTSTSEVRPPEGIQVFREDFLNDPQNNVETPDLIPLLKNSWAGMVNIDEIIDEISNNPLSKLTAGRSVVWFGPVDYEYTGAKHKAQPMPERYSELARALESILGYPKNYFNSVLANSFPPGKKIGAHSDDENIFVRKDRTVGAVATLSLGGSARITITDKKTRKQEDSFVINNGDIYVMPDGKFQTEKKHAVGASAENRVSVTFRHVASSKIPTAPEPTAPEPTAPGAFNIQTAVLNSGGAAGADTQFEMIGKRYGLQEQNVKHYWMEGGRKPPRGNTLLTEEQKKEAKPAVEEAARDLGKNAPTNPGTVALIHRNWFQIKNSDAVFAIVEGLNADPDKIVDANPNLSEAAMYFKKQGGGTGWAIQMALNTFDPSSIFPTEFGWGEKTREGYNQGDSKPVYVFVQDVKKWYKLQTTFESDGPGEPMLREGMMSQLKELTETPTLTPSFAGIGTRSINEAGRQAIEDLYKKSVGQEVKAAPTAPEPTAPAPAPAPAARPKQIFIPFKETASQVISGIKTQTARSTKLGNEGDIFIIQGKTFVLTKTPYQKTMGDIINQDFVAEGFNSPTELEQAFKNLRFNTSNKARTLWVHEFAPVGETPTAPAPAKQQQTPADEWAAYEEMQAQIQAQIQEQGQELAPNTFFSPSIQKYFNDSPISAEGRSANTIPIGMAKLARSAFKIDPNVEIIVVDTREDFSKNAKLSKNDVIQAENALKNWNPNTDGVALHMGTKKIIMLRTKRKNETVTQDYIRNIFVLGHEFGHILWRQEWEGMTLAQKNMMKKAFEKAKKQTNAPKQWSDENGLEEWASDRFSNFLFNKTLKAKNGADSWFKALVKKLRAAWDELSVAYRKRLSGLEAVGQETFDQWANGVIQAYKDGAKQKVDAGYLGDDKIIHIENMINDTAKKMPPKQRKEYARLMSSLMRYLKGNAKSFPKKLMGLAMATDNFIGKLGQDKATIKRFKEEMPAEHSRFGSPTALLRKMIYGVSQSLDRVGFSNLWQRKKRIYSKDLYGKLAGFVEEIREKAFVESESKTPTYVMEDVPSEMTAKYMKERQEAVFVIDEATANNLKIKVPDLKTLEKEGKKPPMVFAQAREYIIDNVAIIPPAEVMSQKGFDHVWIKEVVRAADRRQYLVPVKAPSAIRKRLGGRRKLDRKLPKLDPAMRQQVIGTIQNAELVKVLQDTENLRHNSTYVPNIGTEKGQLSETAFGIRQLFRYFHGEENLSKYGVRFINDFIPRMLNIEEIVENPALRKALSDLIVKFNKGVQHRRLIQSPDYRVTNKQLFEALRDGKKTITRKDGKTYKVQEDLGFIVKDGYFSTVVRDLQGNIEIDPFTKTPENPEGDPRIEYWETFEVNKELADKIVSDLVTSPDQAFIDLALSDEEHANTDPNAIATDARDLAVGLLPHRSKIFSFIPTQELRKAGLLVSPDITVDRYIGNTIKKKEWEERGGWKRASALIEMIEDPAERRMARTAVKNTLGKYDVDMSSALRKINSWGLFLNISTLLAFAVFASFPDLAGPVLRSKEFKALMTAVRTGRDMWNNPQEAARMAEEIGVATREAMDNMYIHSVDADWMLDTPRQWSDKFFKWTLTEGYTRFMRQFAASMGKQFIMRHSELAKQGNQRSIRYLAELDGLTWQEAKRWEANDYSFSGQDGRKVRDALGRFVEESVIRPNAAERPYWASDPRYALIWQLKAFFYAYGKTIVGGVAREAYSRKRETGTLGAMVPPLMLFATTVLPLTMLGWEFRERTKYLLAAGLPFIEPVPSRVGDMDWGTYWFEVFDRSGVLGPWTMLAQMRQNNLWGDSFMTPLLGPSVERFEDLAKGDFNVSSLIPIYSQLPKR